MEFPGCQLAAEYTDWPEGVDELALEPKLDGYRCSVLIQASGVTLHCRDAAEPAWAANLRHFGEELRELGFSDCLVDGEVMARDWNATGLIRRKSLDDSERARVLQEVRLHVFDLVDLRRLERRRVGRARSDQWVDPTPFEARRAALAERFARRATATVQLVEMFIVDSGPHLLGTYSQCIAEGFEGAIVKRLDAPYVCGARASAWGKLKPRRTFEVRVVSVVPGTGKYAGMVGALQCVDAQGRSIALGSGFTDADRARWVDPAVFERELRGRLVEAEAQAGPSASYIARHPTFLRILPA